MERTRFRIAFAAGVLSTAAMILAALALTDIGHQEADVTLEWKALQVSFVVMGVFHAIALAVLTKAIQRTDSKS